MWSYSSTGRSKNLVLFEKIPENTTREEHHEGCNLLPLMLSWLHTPDNLYLSLFHSSDSKSDFRVLVGRCRHTRKSHQGTEPRPTRRAETVSLDCLAIAYVEVMWWGARASCWLGVSVSVVASVLLRSNEKRSSLAGPTAKYLPFAITKLPFLSCLLLLLVTLSPISLASSASPLRGRKWHAAV
jgi:hypothetical protein